MNKQVIITKKAGQDIPRGYLQTVLKKCPTYMGLAIVDKDEDGNPLLETSAAKKTHDLEEVCKLLAQLKDVPVTMMFGEMQQDFDAETDMMPYVFQCASNVDGQPPTDILAVFLEGNFPNYSKVGEGHTDEYNMWEDYLYPTVLEKFEASDDVEDFFRRLRSTAFEKGFLNPIAHRGVAVFVPYTGDPIAMGINDLGGEFEWGTTSNTFNWGSTTKLEEVAKSAVAAVQKVGGRLSRAMNSASHLPGSPPVEVPKEQPKEQPKQEPKKPDTVDVWKAWPGVSDKTHILMSPAAGLQGNARNRWIRTFLFLSPQDALPKDASHSSFRMPVPIDLVGYAQENATTNEDVKQLQNRVLKFRQTKGSKDAQPVEPSHSTGKQMQDANKEIDTQVAEPGKSNPADFLPESPADELKAAVETVTEWATNPKAPSAVEVQRIEVKWPLFTITSGIKLSDVARWTMKEKKEFTKKYPHEAARLISQLMLRLHEHKEFEQVEVKNPVPDHKTKPAQVEVSPAGPQSTAPRKTGRLARATGRAA